MQAYLTQVYESIAASRKLRGKPVESFADWLAIVKRAADAERQIRLGA